MKLPYQTRKTVLRVLIAVAVIAVAAVLAWVCWILRLQRFVVYSREEGARLEFELPQTMPQGVLAEEPVAPTVSIYFNEGEDQVTASAELAKVVGYYIDEKQLKGDMNQIKSQIRALEKGTPVMLDVKNIYGRFFYNSAVSTQRSDEVDPAAVEDLIAFLNSSGMYTIARFSSLRDYHYGLNNVPDGVPHSSGGYLYQDDGGCYWLNPDSGGTMKFLVDIIMELKDKGFNEVVLSEFRFPRTDSILYSGDKAQALSTAAQTLLKTCSTSSFAVSFGSDGDWELPEGRTRRYLENVEAGNVAEAAAGANVKNPDINLVFVTQLHDTRFDEYGVLRPLDTLF